MATYWLDEVQFDTGVRTLDEGWTFPSEADILADNIDVSFDASFFQYIVNLEAHMSVLVSIDVDFEYAEPIPLLSLVPEKFRDSELLQVYLKESGLLLGKLKTDAKELLQEINPNTVKLNRVQQLSDLTGTKIRLKNNKDEISDLESARTQLNNAVGGYRIKGTRQSIKNVAYTHGLTIDVNNLHSEDYATFIRKPGIVFENGEEIL